MKYRNITFLAAAIILFFSQSSSAQKAWEKDWHKWSKEDCIKILNDSPWAYNFAGINVQMMTNELNKSSTSMDSASPMIVLRLYSSLTIKRALLRQIQLDQKYDKMNDKQKAELDEKTKNYLDCAECKDYYVLIMMQPAGKTAKTLVGKKFINYDLNFLKDNIYITSDKGETRQLAQYIAPQSESGYAVFFFKRLDEKQKPLLTNESKSLNVFFKRGNFNKEGTNFLIDKIEFDISKIIIGDKVDF